MLISGIVVLLATALAARMISERGYRTLTDEQKVRLMDGFSTQRAYSLIPLVLLIGGFFLLISNTDLDRTLLTTAYFGLLVLYVLIKAVFNHWKMKSLEMPASYRRHFLASQAIAMLGVAWLLYAMAQTSI